MPDQLRWQIRSFTLCAALLMAASLPLPAPAQGRPREAPLYNDSHIHLTNYVQEGTDIADFVRMMGGTVRRSVLFGIPLQQMRQFGNTGDFAPTYYLQTDAPLDYYSYVDAMIALAYLSLPPAQRACLDPMISGFNPADMYATDRVRRVLLAFPGVFSGIGEFTIHKEFASSKIAGGPPTLGDRALHRLLDFAGEVRLVVVIHNDADVPFPKPGQDPYMIAQLRELFAAHPNTTIVWAHLGVGRIIEPIPGHLAMLERALSSIACATSTSTSPGSRWRSTSPRRQRRSGPRPRSSTATPIASSSAPTSSPPAA